MKSHDLQAIFNQMKAESLRLDGTDRPLEILPTKCAELERGFLTHFDAGESAFLTRALLFVQAKQVTQVFLETKALQFFPVDGSIPSGAESFSTPIWNLFGKAKLVANYATDFPSVDAAQSENILPCRSLGVSFSYSIQDLRRSAMAGGQPLDQRKAGVARMVNEQLIDTICALGDTTSGLLGLTQNSGVTIITAGGGTITGAWASAAGSVIFTDLMQIGGKVVVQSKNTWRADTLLLPTVAYTQAAQKPANSFSQESALAAFLRTNPYGITNIDMWPALDTAGAAGVTRAMAYKRDPNCVDIKIPQPFELIAPQPQNMAFNVPGHSRVGGGVVYHPASMVYADGL